MPKNSPPFMASAQEASEGGPRMVGSSTRESVGEVPVSTMSDRSSVTSTYPTLPPLQMGVEKKRKRKSTSSTHASRATTRRKISSGKSKNSKAPTQSTSSSATSVVASTSGAKDSPGFWNSYSPSVSEMLSSCTETDLVDLQSTSWSKSLKRRALTSWFTVRVKRAVQTTENTNCAKTSWPLPLSLWRALTEEDPPKTKGSGNKKSKNTKKKKEEKKEDKNASKAEVGKKRKKRDEPEKKSIESDAAAKVRKKPPVTVVDTVRLYPNKKQQQTLRKWFGAARWTYNRSVHALNENFKSKEKEGSLTIKDLRNLCVNRKAFPTVIDPDSREAGILEVPYEVRDNGMRDARKALASNLAKCKKDPSHKFKLSFRSKKDRSQSIAILKKRYESKSSKEWELLSKIRARGRPMPERATADMRLVMKYSGEFYLHMPKEVERRSEKQAPTFDSALGGVAALDIGVRTFQTVYDATGAAHEWGAADMGRIQRLCYHLDDLVSRYSCSKEKVFLSHRRRWRMKKAAKRMRKKVRSLVGDLHRKLARWLCENYRYILIPKFETKQMSAKATRKIGRRSVRQMLTWSHYRFRQHLLNKAREYPWVRVEECEEPYTSKTCGSCGAIHWKLGSSKVFRCPCCNYVADRDVNGARNILLRHITLRALEEPGLRTRLGLHPLGRRSPPLHGLGESA